MDKLSLTISKLKYSYISTITKELAFVSEHTCFTQTENMNGKKKTFKAEPGGVSADTYNYYKRIESVLKDASITNESKGKSM